MLAVMSKKQSWISEIGMLIWPILLWLLLFLPFLTGHIVLNKDTNANYAFVKYFWNNILNGVWPLWDPFLYYGRPYIATSTCGVLNPLSALVPLQVILGIDYYHAYINYLVFYFILGCLGFYLFVKEVFKENFIALISFILVLFSGLGPMLFNQVYIILLFVPAAWFFYCLVIFLKNFSQKSFMGLVFCTMMAVISYVPFYLITVLMVTILFWAVLFSKDLNHSFKAMLSFFIKNKLNVFLTIVSIGIVLLPLFMLKINSDSGVFISPARQECDVWNDKLEQCASGFQMTYIQAGTTGTFSQRVGVSELIGHLDKRHYGLDTFFYIPFSAIFMIILGAFTCINRVRILILMVALSIFFISIGNTAPYYAVLYKIFPLFHFFRNLFFYLSFLIPLILLFAVGQFQATLNEIRIVKKGSKVLLAMMLIFVTALLLLLLNDVLLSSWITLIVLTMITILTYLNKLDVRRGVGFIALMFALVIEPIEVFMHYTERFNGLVCTLPASHTKPEFSFVRYNRDMNEINCSIYHRWCEGYGIYWYDMALKDNLILPNSSPDLISLNLLHFLRSSTTDQQSLDYLKNKVIIYDKSKHGVQLKEPTLKVNHFDVNSVTFELHLTTNAYFVYNDNFDPNWEVTVNGQRAVLHKANMSFKGVMITPGYSKITFVYSPLGGTTIMWGIITFIYLFLGYCIFIWIRKEPDL